MITKQHIMDSLRVTPAVIVELVRSADPATLKHRPQPDKWSIHEHACHLAEVQPIMMRRLEYILSAETPHIKSYNPAHDDPHKLLNLDLNESLTRLQNGRKEFIAKLEALSEKEWNKPATHDEYAQYSIAIMARHVALHDYLHGYRIEQLIIEKKA